MLGSRPQLVGDALSMREQYRALAEQTNAASPLTPNVHVGRLALVQSIETKAANTINRRQNGE
jgi:hypothetical protein